MPTDWIKQHVKPSLVTRYEQEMTKLRGEPSSAAHIVDNINKMNSESEQIEIDAERHARDLDEDAAQEQFFRNNK
jgi:hypothetical protein